MQSAFPRGGEDPALSTPQQLQVRQPSSPSTMMLQRTVVVPSKGAHGGSRSLCLAVLACEPRPPYGPNEHTARLLLDLLEQSLMRGCDDSIDGNRPPAPAAENSINMTWTLILDVFDAQQEEYPHDYDAYDGFLIPGSFAAAYDDDAWIAKLRRVIQKELVQHCRPTIGVCFGHQVIAHSFDDGRATKMPSGARAARQTMQLTKAGKRLFRTSRDANDTSNDCIDMFVTHGDMVERLPSTAVNLGGCNAVPIQAAAYFATPQEAKSSHTRSLLVDGAADRPFAVTFQAHPEYATSTDMGMERTLFECMDAMVGRGALDELLATTLKGDAKDYFVSVQAQSILAMTTACKLLGWF